MKPVLIIGFAGFVGTVARYGLSLLVDQRFGIAFPYGTMAVNVLGCILAGFLFQAFETRFPIDPAIRTVVFVGFLGGFTTFSAYALQTFSLIRDGLMVSAALNVILSNVLGVAGIWAGYVLARNI